MALKAVLLLALLAASHGTPVNVSPTSYQVFETNHITVPYNIPTPSYRHLSTGTANVADSTPEPSIQPQETTPPVKVDAPSPDIHQQPGSIVLTLTPPFYPRLPLGRPPLVGPRFPLMAQRFFFRRAGFIPYPVSTPYQNYLQQLPVPNTAQTTPYSNNISPIVIDPIHVNLNRSSPFEYEFECRPNCLRPRSVLPFSWNLRIGCYPIRLCTRLILIHAREPVRSANVARAGLRAANLARNRARDRGV